ncbi:hypothetical protein OAH87_04770, partial [Marinomonas sp.]
MSFSLESLNVKTDFYDQQKYVPYVGIQEGNRLISPASQPKKHPIGPIETFQVDGLTHDAKGVARLHGKV